MGENELLEEDFDYELSYDEIRRMKRIEKQRQRMEKGEPSLISFIMMRIAELLIPEVILSLILSLTVYHNIIPSYVNAVQVALSITLAVYIIYTAVTTHHIFWALGDVSKYVAINLGGYAAVVIVSIIARAINIQLFSWMFMPTKIFTTFGLSAWSSLFISHGIIIVVMLIITLINLRLFTEPAVGGFEDEEEE